MKIKSAYYTEGAKDLYGKNVTPYLEGAGGKAKFLIRCSVCHYGLCKVITIARIPSEDENIIFVGPCPICMESARTAEPVHVIPQSLLGDKYQGLEMEE